MVTEREGGYEPQKSYTGRFLIIPGDIATGVMSHILNDETLPPQPLPKALIDLLDSTIPPECKEAAFRGADFMERCAQEWQELTNVQLPEPSQSIAEELRDTFVTMARKFPTVLRDAIGSEETSQEESEQYWKRVEELRKEYIPEAVFPGYTQTERCDDTRRGAKLYTVSTVSY